MAKSKYLEVVGLRASAKLHELMDAIPSAIICAYAQNFTQDAGAHDITTNLQLIFRTNSNGEKVYRKMEEGDDVLTAASGGPALPFSP